MKVKQSIAALIFGIAIASTPVSAEDIDARIQEIETQISGLRAELNTLKASQIGEDALSIQNKDGLSLVYEKHERSTSYDGKPCITVYFTFANDSSENNTFEWSLNVRAYQNGIQIDHAYVSVPEYDNNSRDIQPGASIMVCQSFELMDETADVQIDVDDMISFSSEVLGSQILSLQ